MRTITSLVCMLLLVGCAQDQSSESPSSANTKANRVVLFDGSDTSAWVGKNGEPCPWPVVDGALQSVKKGDIQTKDKYLDYKLHVEFRTPVPQPGQSGQHKGNSGVFLDNKYEIQVLDSYGIDPPTKGDCGSVYNHRAPEANMSKPPMQWQSYDITFRAPRFDESGKTKTANARVSVVWNGRVVHDDFEIPGPTRRGDTQEFSGPGVIRLQDHGHPVEFRNIWLEPIQ